jgi:hypothetical protein
MMAVASGEIVWGSKFGAGVVPATIAALAARTNVTNTLRMGAFFFLVTSHYQSLTRIYSTSRWWLSNLRTFLAYDDVAEMCGQKSVPRSGHPGRTEVSVLLTRLYAPSGDFAEPAYTARTSHWAASVKREARTSVASSTLGIAGTTSLTEPSDFKRSLGGRGSRAVGRRA